MRVLVVGALIVAAYASPLSAQESRVTAVSRAPFAKVAAALQQAVVDHKMGLVCHANAPECGGRTRRQHQGQPGSHGVP